MPSFKATLNDHLDEGWGLPELAGDDRPEERRIWIHASPAQITAHEAALLWPIRFLHPEHVGSARMVCLWAACKAAKRPFDKAVKAKATVGRATAFRLVDRGLTLISVGLDREGGSPRPGLTHGRGPFTIQADPGPAGGGAAPREDRRSCASPSARRTSKASLVRAGTSTVDWRN